MAKRITTDTEYWQLKDDCEKAYAASEKETDKKRRKELLSTVKENQKLLADYAKKEERYACFDKERNQTCENP